MATVNDFLNPNSILTPGIAGGLATTIAMPLAVNFGISIPWLVLASSFLLSLLIVSGFEAKVTRPRRALYCVLNTMIIFSTSIGAAHQIDKPPQPPAAPGAAAPGAGIADFLLSSAHAQPAGAAPRQPIPAGTTLRQPLPAATPAAPGASIAAPTAAAAAAADAQELAKLRAQVKELEDYRRKQQDYERRAAEYNQRWRF